MPRLLQINSCLNKSTGRIAQQIGEKAIEAGFESVIAYPIRAGACSSQSSTFEIGTKLDAACHALNTRLFDKHGLGSVRATRKLVQQIDDLIPSIIHLHNIHGYYINYPILFEYLANKDIPVVWTFHDCWPFTGHCVHFTDVNCLKWEAGTCDNCPKKKGYPTSMLFDRSRKNYRDKKMAFTSLRNLTIVPVSYWLGDMVKRSFMKDYPIHVIQNGIDIKTFYPRNEAAKKVREKYCWGDKFVILGVAVGWSKDVGLDTFIKLRSRLSAQFAIVMVGVTENQKRFLPEGITGINRTNNQEELAEIYSAADVLFNGSYQETFGLVTAEAMACGTPAIVYDSTACPEIVDNDRGRIIPVGDFDKLLEAIKSLEGLSEFEKEKMSDTCVDYVRTHLDKNNKYQEYIQLYQKILSNDRYDHYHPHKG